LRGNTSVFFAPVANRAAPTASRSGKIGKKKEKGATMKLQDMKFATVSKSLLMGLALLLASSAFAATKASLNLTDATVVNGTQLKAGDYKLEWEGNGPNVEVNVMKGKNVVAKVPAHVVDLQSPALNNAAVVRHNDDGTTALAGVRFQGKKYALELGDSAAGMSSSPTR
jgi:hypothetical protein